MCLCARWDAQAGAWDAFVEPGRSLCWGSDPGNRRTCSGHCWWGPSPTLPGRPQRSVSVCDISKCLCVSASVFWSWRHSHGKIKSSSSALVLIAVLLMWCLPSLYSIFILLCMCLFLSESDWLSFCACLFTGPLCSDCVHVFSYVVHVEYSVCSYTELLRFERERSWSVSNFSTIIVWLSLHIDCCLSLSGRCRPPQKNNTGSLTDWQIDF